MDQKIRRKLRRITDILWAGGVTNPVTYIEQISYLIYLKLLDEEESNRVLSCRHGDNDNAEDDVYRVATGAFTRAHGAAAAGV